MNILVAFRRFTMLWNYNFCLVLKHFSHLVPIKQLLSIPSLWQPLVCICLDVLSPSVYFIHMEPYSMWPFVPGFSHLACFQGFFHVVACISTSFFYAWVIFHVFICHNLFINLSVDRYLVCLYVCAKHACRYSHWSNCFKFFGYTPRSGISVWYGNSMFNLLKNDQTVSLLNFFRFSSTNIKTKVLDTISLKVSFPWIVPRF